jgi:hypothetical protein
MQIPTNSVITICRAWLAVNTYIWVLILIGCYKHIFDSLTTAAFAHGAVIILVTKQMQFCIKIYKNGLCVSGVFWLPCIFYTLKFHNYKSNYTCWRRTTARLTTVGNFNYKIGTMFKHIHTIISSLYTAALCFSFYQLIHQESTTCGLQDKFFVMFRLILAKNVQQNNYQMWSISCSYLGRIGARMIAPFKKMQLFRVHWHHFYSKIFRKLPLVEETTKRVASR